MRWPSVADRPGLAVVAAGRSTWPPGPIATTTTSCGRPPPSSRARPRSATPSRRRRTRSATAFFQDVLPVATDATASPRGLLPFPPLPALAPAAVRGVCAAWRPTTRRSSPSLAAVDVALCWWMLGRLPVGSAVRLATTIFFAFGTVFWYTRPARHDLVPGPHRRGRADACSPSGWRSRADPGRPGRRAGLRRPATAPPPTAARRPAWRDRLSVDPRQFVAGLLFGLACTARLTVVFAAPFFMLVGGGRRLAAAELVGRARRGHPGRPAAGLQRGHDRPRLPPGLRLPVPARDARLPGARLPPRLGGRGPALPPPERGDHVPDRPGRSSRPTLPDSLGVNATTRLHRAGRDARPVRPSTARWPSRATSGMSVLLTSPAYLLRCPPCGATAAAGSSPARPSPILVIVVVNLMHFSQGWVQFGYRFSNDVGAVRARPRGARPASASSMPAGAGRCRWRWPSSSSRSPSTPGASPGAGCSDGEPRDRPPRSRRRPARRSGSSPSSRPGRRCCPASPSGTPPSSRPSRPLLGTAHPTGFPTYVLLGWLAIRPPEPVRRAGLPDEPVRRRCRVAVAAGGHGRPRPDPDPLDRAGRRRRARPRPDAGRLGDRHARRGARAPSRAPRDPAPPARRLGGRPASGRRPPDGRTARLAGCSRRVVFGLSVGNHSLTLLLALPVGLYVLAVEPGILRRPRLVAAVHRWRSSARSSSSSSSCRCGPGRSAPPLVYGTPETWDGFWYIVLAEQFQGSLDRPVRRPGGQVGRARASRAIAPVRALAALIPAGLVTAAFVRPALRPADRHGRGHHLLLRGVLRRTPTSGATTWARSSSPGPGSRSSPRRSSTRR